MFFFRNQIQFNKKKQQNSIPSYLFLNDNYRSNNDDYHNFDKGSFLYKINFKVVLKSSKKKLTKNEYSF